MLRALAGVLVAAMASGCAPPDCEGTYHFHESFPLEWRDDVQMAAGRWNAFGAGKITVVAGDETNAVCSFRVVVGETPEYVHLSPKSASARWAGISRTYDSSIAFCPDHWAPSFVAGGGHLGAQDIAMHEIGHVFGLEHIANPRAVMTRSHAIPIIEYTPADHIECERVWACLPTPYEGL